VQQALAGSSGHAGMIAALAVELLSSTPGETRIRADLLARRATLPP